eukprot:774835-Amphidinium_carterae.1
MVVLGGELDKPSCPECKLYRDGDYEHPPVNSFDSTTKSRMAFSLVEPICGSRPVPFKEDSSERVDKFSGSLPSESAIPRYSVIYLTPKLLHNSTHASQYQT